MNLHNRLLARIALTAAVALGGAACGGSTNNPHVLPPQPGSGSNCSASASGAVTATLTCTAVAVYNSQKNQMEVAIAGNGSNGQQSLIFGIDVPGSVRSGTFSSTDATAPGAVVFSAASTSWMASNQANPSQGSFTLNVSGTDQVATGSTGTAYALHGSLDASAPSVAGSGSSGTVTLHATF